MKKFKKIIGFIAGILVIFVGLSLIGGNMTTLKHEISINVPKKVVFSTLANLELVSKYNPAVMSAKYISTEHNGIGAARECDLGKDGMVREKITAFEIDKSISMELYEHNWPLEFMTWTTQVETVNNATLVSQTMEYKVKFGLIGMLLDKLVMKNKLDKTMHLVFESMKTYIEKENI